MLIISIRMIIGEVDTRTILRYSNLTNLNTCLEVVERFVPFLEWMKCSLVSNMIGPLVNVLAYVKGELDVESGLEVLTR